MPCHSATVAGGCSFVMKFLQRIRGTISFKIFIGFLVLIALIYVYSMQINLWGREEVKREISQSTLSKIDYSLDNLEKDISNMIRIQRKLGLDSDLYAISMTATDMSHYDVLMAVLRLQQKLIDLKSMSQYIDGVSVYVPLINKKITTDYIYDFSLEEYVGMANLTVLQTGSIVVNENHIFSNTIPWYYVPNENNLNDIPFIISVKLSNASLESMLQTMSEKPLIGAMLLGDMNALNIFSASESRIAAEISRYLEQHSAGESSGIDNLLLDKRMFIVAFEKSNLLEATLVAYTDEAVLLAPLKRYNLWSWILTILLIAAVLLFVLWIRRIITSPMDMLMVAFKKLEEGNFNQKLTFNRNDEFSFLYHRFNETLQRIRVLIEQVYEQKILAQNAELKQLQYQISPHFLYNNMYNIYRIAKLGDMESVMNLTLHLGSYYQYITKGLSMDVPLIEEMKHATNYLEVQKIRFYNKVRVTLSEIPDACKNLMVPKLIVQPIIENAFVHGVNRNGNCSEIRVTLVKDFDQLRISVEDNGQGMNAVELESMQQLLASEGPNTEYSGLLNVHRRLQIKFGQGSGLRLSISEMGGLKVDLAIATRQGGQSCIIS